jgi:UDP-N-acetylglucosamine--N-acetylmuramyl-(pentapeptide) pyrophosphoryl-undecaprenol N-acetylglucosamine transferase
LYAINGKGMGHLNRTLVLAQAMRRAAPRTDLRFVVHSPMYRWVEARGFPVIKLPDRNHPLSGPWSRPQRHAGMLRVFEALFRAYRPDLLVTDFLCSKEVFSLAHRSQANVAVVLRKQTPAAMRSLRWDPGSRLVDRWWIPHAPEELPAASLPRRFRPRSVYLGPVRRSLEAGRIPDVRRRYAEDAEALIVLTVGGGGSPHALSTLHSGRDAIRDLGGKVRGVILYGPLFPSTIPPDEERLAHRRFEGDLPELLAAADAVICNAGYNTIEELRSSGTPGVVVPLAGLRRDDQGARARQLQSEGRALCVAAEVDAIRDALGTILDGRGPEKHIIEAADAGPDPMLRLGERLLESVNFPGDAWA